ncbi:MAG: 3-hydroxybutyrate dehydrogenase [Alphaproteobacteria bacterium]|nr:3-hydroxybutyrate dehydrogenase [Alphaproteobacteria bacterium]
MLKGKTALVTGSTTGIGLGIARALAGEGCNIMLNGFGDKTAIEEIRAGLAKKAGVEVGYNGADLSDADQISSLIHDTVSSLGGIDILVNNAGIQHTAPVTEFPADIWDKIIAIMLTGAFHTIQNALPHMLEKSWGRIINTSSVHGLVASINKAAYVSAKHGIMGLTKVVALETAQSGVTCNAINPGFVHTDLVQAQIEDRATAIGKSPTKAAHDLLSKKQPSLDFVTVEQIGALCVFLCSDAAAQITGIPVPIDGGWTAQ